MSAVKKCAPCGAEYPTLPANGRPYTPEDMGLFAGLYATCKCGNGLYWTWAEFMVEVRKFDAAHFPRAPTPGPEAAA